MTEMCFWVNCPFLSKCSNIKVKVGKVKIIFKLVTNNNKHEKFFLSALSALRTRLFFFFFFMENRHFNVKHSKLFKSFLAYIYLINENFDCVLMWYYIFVMFTLFPPNKLVFLFNSKLVGFI